MVVDRIESLIKEHGYALQGVFAVSSDDVSFTYSVGLSDRGWPELVMAGINIVTASHIITSLVDDYATNERIPCVGDVIDHLTNFPFRLGPVTHDNLDEYLPFAMWWARKNNRPLQALQLVMTDAHGRWPEDKKYSDFMKRAQPILGWMN